MKLGVGASDYRLRQSSAVIFDKILEDWGDWRDFKNLPYSLKRGVGRERVGVKAEDPTKKHGIVGAFCRTFNVEEAIAEFLPKIYKRSKVPSRKPRYTYVDGSGRNGVVVEDDGLFIYSHHGSDPCGGRLVNAFDMVRLHLFSQEDEGYDEDGDPRDLPSYSLMSEFARDIAAVDHDFQQDMDELDDKRIREEFEDLPPLDDDDDDDEDEPEGDIEPEVSDLGIPEELLRFPEGSVLNLVVDYYNATALVEQRQFAMQAGVIFGSVVLGRNHRTDYGKPNYPTVFTINVGDTGSGKESIKDAVEQLLEAAELDHLIGSRDYTSEAAVMSKLLEKPKHVSFIDELGKRLKDDRKGGGNGQKDSAYTAFLELFSKCHGTYRGTAMSTNNKTKEEVQAIQSRKIVRPALTLAGLTTPETFYGAVSAADVSSGFLNRFLIVQSQMEPFQEQRIDIPEVDPPPRLIRWAKKKAFATGEEADGGGDIKHHVDTTMDVEPVVMPFSRKAYRFLRTMETERVTLQREFAQFGLADLFSRTREIAMRLSLIVAVSCDSEWIELSHLKWAWSYVKFYHRQTAEAFRANAGKSDLHKIADEVADFIRSKGADGITEFKVFHHRQTFAKLHDREKDQVRSFLRDIHGIVLQKTPRSTSGKYFDPKFAPKRKRRD